MVVLVADPPAVTAPACVLLRVSYYGSSCPVAVARAAGVLAPPLRLASPPQLVLPQLLFFQRHHCASGKLFDAPIYQIIAAIMLNAFCKFDTVKMNKHYKENLKT